VEGLRGSQGRTEVNLHSLVHLRTVHLGREGSLANGFFNYTRLSLIETSLRLCVVIATSVVVAEIYIQVNFISSFYLRQVLRVIQVSHLTSR
jgi:hypothetical protein